MNTREQMKTSVHINPKAAKAVTMKTICQDQKRMNFTINEAGVKGGGTNGDIDHMIFNVTSVERNGEEPEAVWLDGSLFNALISHGLKKVKCVFDQTISGANNWISIDDMYRNNNMAYTNLLTQDKDFM